MIQEIDPGRAQEAYCEKNGFPVLRRPTGTCYSCRRNIFEHQATKNDAGTSLITGCPFCCASFCD